MLAVLFAALSLCVGCTYTDSGEDTPHVAGPPPEPSTLTTKEDPAPKFVSKSDAGEDTRYVLSYRGRVIHIIAGESGLFGIKVMADEGEISWDNLWLTFSPRRVRPREHTEDELAPEGEVNLDFVAEEIRGYVQDARQLALHLAPQTPQTGEKAASPPRARSVIREINLPPVAANELAIFARTENLTVTQNLKVPTQEIPGDPSNWHIQFKEFAASTTYVPAGAWCLFKVVVRHARTTFFVLRDAEGSSTGYVEFYARSSKGQSPTILDQFATSKGGIISVTYYEPVEGDPLIIEEEVRTAGGIAQSIIDGDLLIPPETFRQQLLVLVTLIKEREKASSYKIQREGLRGIDPILQEFEVGG